jgi:predicted nucleotide-binding protein
MKPVSVPPPRQFLRWFHQLEDEDPQALIDGGRLLQRAIGAGVVDASDADGIGDLVSRLREQGNLFANLGLDVDYAPPAQVLQHMQDFASTAQGRAWAASEPERAPAAAVQAAEDPQAVAVAHGRDEEARRAVFDLLRAMGLKPLEWDDLIKATGSAAPYTGEAVTLGFQKAQAVVVLFTPDDEVRLHPDLASAESVASRLQPRPNALLEAGMALATHPRQTVLIAIGDVLLPTNLDGRNFVRLDGGTGGFNALIRRLDDAGCQVDRSGTDWLEPKRIQRLKALTRRPSAASSAPTDEPVGELDDDFTLNVKAAVGRAGADLTDRQLAALPEILKTHSEPFDSFEIANALPAPTIGSGPIKRVLTQLYTHGQLARPVTGRGFMRAESVPEARQQ